MKKYLSCFVLLAFFIAPVLALGQSEYGTPAEARAMLEKAVSMAKRDRHETGALFTSGEGTFNNKDLYPYCFNAEGVFTVHPTLVGKHVKYLSEGKFPVDFVSKMSHLGKEYLGKIVKTGKKEVFLTCEGVELEKRSVKKTSMKCPGGSDIFSGAFRISGFHENKAILEKVEDYNRVYPVASATLATVPSEAPLEGRGSSQGDFARAQLPEEHGEAQGRSSPDRMVVLTVLNADMTELTKRKKMNLLHYVVYEGDRAEAQGKIYEVPASDFGADVYASVKEGEIVEIPYMWTRPGSAELVDKVAYATRIGDQVCAVGYYK